MAPEPSEQRGDRAEHRPLRRPQPGPPPVREQPPVGSRRRRAGRRSARRSTPSMRRRARRRRRRESARRAASACGEPGSRPLEIEQQIRLAGAEPDVRRVRAWAPCRPRPATALTSRAPPDRRRRPRASISVPSANRRCACVGRSVGRSPVPRRRLVEVALEQLVVAADHRHHRGHLAARRARRRASEHCAPRPWRRRRPSTPRRR